MHQLLISHEQFKMKSMIVVALALVAVVAALPADEPVGIIRSEFNQEPEGSYNFGFETENGIARSEQGEVKDVLDEENKPHKVVVVRGTYSYTDKDGNSENINYYADETGYHADGPSVPKAA